jgi:hypothetical protein
MMNWREGGRVDEESQARHGEGWECYLEAERRELEMRRNQHLAKMLGAPLSGESVEELDRITQEDRSARAEAERVLTRWLIDRQARRQPPTGGSW